MATVRRALFRPSKGQSHFILQADEGGTGRGGSGEGERIAARGKKQREKGKDHAAHRE